MHEWVYASEWCMQCMCQYQYVSCKGRIKKGEGKEVRGEQEMKAASGEVEVRVPAIGRGEEDFIPPHR